MKTKLLLGLILTILLLMPAVASTQTLTQNDVEIESQPDSDLTFEIEFEPFDGNDDTEGCQWVYQDGEWRYICT